MVSAKQAKNTAAPKSSENYWMTVLLYFASFLIGLGIVAEVAANWQQIPNAVKLGSAVMLMIANGAVLTWCVKKEKNILKQVVAVIYAFLIMGTIGLIGQIFQLPSNFANGCLLWSLVSWPLFLFVPRLLWLWLPLFYVGMRFYNIIFGDIIDLVIGNNIDFETRQLFFAKDHPVLQISGFVAFYGIFMAYEYLISSKHKDNTSVIKPLRFYIGLLVMGIYSASAEFVQFVPAVAENMRPYIYFFAPYLALAVLLYIYNGTKDRFSFMPLFLAGIVPEALLALAIGNRGWFGQNIEAGLPIVFLAIMLIYAYYHKMPRLRKLTIVGILMWFIFTFEENVFDIIPSLLICATFAFMSYKAQSRKGFNTFVILAVLRILIYYADVEDLEHMGLYLIASGILMIATILGLFKYGKLLWRTEDEK